MPFIQSSFRAAATTSAAFGGYYSGKEGWAMAGKRRNDPPLGYQMRNRDSELQQARGAMNAIQRYAKRA